MVRKMDDYILIKTQADFEKNISVFEIAAREGKEVKIALAPDFDANIIWEKNSYSRFYHAYIEKIIHGTTEIYTKDKQAEIINKIITNVENRWGWKDPDYSSYILYKDVLENGHNSVVLFLQGFYFQKDGVLKDKRNKNLYSKYITPDNQIVLGEVGSYYFGKLGYNFSGLQFENQRLVESVLPKENNLSKIGTADKTLMEKYYREFKGQRIIDVKKLFPGAKNPELLYDLKRGKIDVQIALRGMDRGDYKFIRPAQDFAGLSPTAIYEIMSQPGLHWDALQVRAMMNLIVDKADYSYFDEIVKLINANKHIFLAQNEDNFKLWVKIESKFADKIKSSKEYADGVKKSLEQARKDIDKDTKNIRLLIPQRDYLVAEEERLKSVLAMAEGLKKNPDNNNFFANHAENIIRAVNDFIKNGVVREIRVPEKPWKLFAFDKEKKLYAELIDIIAWYNKYTKDAVEKRAELFADCKFNLEEKIYKLKSEINRLDESNGQNWRLLGSRQYWQEENEPGVVFDKNIQEQKAAKQKRFDAAKKKMQEKGIVFGQKSGVVRADEIAKDTRIKNKVAQLRKMKGAEKMTDAELRQLAIEKLFGKQK